MDIREALAEHAHRIWAEWWDWVLTDAAIENPDGSITIPAHRMAWWRRQIATPYAELSEREKDSDRKEADRILAIVRGS